MNQSVLRDGVIEPPAIKRQPKTLTDATLQRIRGDIISQRLKPGEKLKAQELTQRYSVGNSPLREALFQLVSDRFVKSDGQRGFSVTELTASDLMDITNWRAELECTALQLSMSNRTVEWESEVIAAHHRLEGLQIKTGLDRDEAADIWEARHREYHFTLYSRCGSPWLLRFCELLADHGERYRRGFVDYPRVPESIRTEHKAILDAVVNQQDAEAIDLLRKHILTAASLASEHLRAQD